MVSKRLENVAPFSDALPLLSSRLPPLSTTYATQLSHLEPTCKRPPRGAFLSLFHGLSLACCTIIITSPHSSFLLLFLLDSFLFFNFVIPISLHFFSLICSYSFLIGKPFWFGRKQRNVWNLYWHFPSCTLLCFYALYQTGKKDALPDWRCSYIMMSLSM